MRHYSSRNRQPAGPDIYWRRRALALAAGIAVVALLAWAVNGTLSNPATTQSASVTKASGKQAGDAAGPGQAGQGQARPNGTQPGHGAAGPGGSPGSTSGHGRPSASASPAHSKATRPSSRPSRKASGRAAGSCRARDLVLTLVTPEHWYRAGAWPMFEAYVVNTGSRPCRFNTGYRSLAVVIRSGPARVWGSGDCGGGRASRRVRLARGVPEARRVSWNRRTSFPGCHLKGGFARPGHYSATLVSGHLSSKPVRFVLRGSAAAQP